MSRRVERVNELLRHEISRLLILQTKDPRLGGVITITRVVTARDLRKAQVFISVMGKRGDQTEYPGGYPLRRCLPEAELRPRLNLRYIPFLNFALDDSLEEADHILGIMDHIRDNQPTDPLWMRVTPMWAP